MEFFRLLRRESVDRERRPPQELTRVDRRLDINKGSFSQGDPGPGFGRGRPDELRDRSDTLGERGNGEDTYPSPVGETAGEESNSSRRSRLPAGFAYNWLTHQIEQPFPRISRKVRERIERRTGRSPEDSYSGFTQNLSEATSGYSLEDLLRTRRRGWQRPSHFLRSKP